LGQNTEETVGWARTQPRAGLRSKPPATELPAGEEVGGPWCPKPIAREPAEEDWGCAVDIPGAWPKEGGLSPGLYWDGNRESWERLFLRGSCRGIMSRVRLHPWAGTFPWKLDSGEEARFFKATRAPGHLERGSSWPHGHLLPRWAPQHPAPDGTGRAFLGRSSAPNRLPPSCHPRDSGLATFHGSPLSLGHARHRALWSARGLRGPDCTLSHHT